MTQYAHPDVLVNIDELDQYQNNPRVTFVQVDEDTLLYEMEHLPGAVKLDWHTELQRPDVRDFISATEFAELMERKGISNDSLVLLYGDQSNWWAAYAFWFFKYNGHENVKLINGGLKKLQDSGVTLTAEAVEITPGSYRVPYRDASIRAFAPDVLRHLFEVQAGTGSMVDVRSFGEYTGEKLHMDNYPQEGALRGGHIPGAASIPWSKAVADDGTFLPVDELRALYVDAGVLPEHSVIAYCRIAERSSHSWFVLKYLLGYPDVRNYDGSWTEWGNMVGVPVAQGPNP